MTDEVRTTEKAVEDDEKTRAAETTEPAVEATEPVDDTEEPVVDEPVSPAVTANRRSSSRFILPIVLTVVLLASAAVTTWFYFARYQPDQKVDQAVAARVIESASDGAVALLSYTPETLDEDFASAKTRLTGDFLNYYTQFTEQIVTPAARQKSVKTSAAVVRSALSTIDQSSAEVLLFINQQTVSKENPDGSFTASSVRVKMTKVGDDWLISAFDPV